MLQEVLDVFAAIESEGVLNTVQIQTPTFGIDGEVIAVRRKTDRLSCVKAKACQFYVVSNCEGPRRLLRRCDGRTFRVACCADAIVERATQACKRNEKEPDDFHVARQGKALHATLD